jgi:hypothetical protein
MPKDWTDDYIKAVEKHTKKPYDKTTEKELRAFLRSNAGKPYRYLFGMK